MLTAASMITATMLSACGPSMSQMENSVRRRAEALCRIRFDNPERDACIAGGRLTIETVIDKYKNSDLNTIVGGISARKHRARVKGWSVEKCETRTNYMPGSSLYIACADGVDIALTEIINGHRKFLSGCDPRLDN